MSKKTKIILGIALLILIAVMVFVSLKKNSGDTIEVTSVQVERGDITKTVSGSGYIQPELDVEISARISAEIIRIHVKEGEQVKKGQLLVDLDSQRYEAIVEQAESGVMSARASLKKANADYSRMQSLFQQKLASQADLDAAEAEMMLRESTLQQAQAGLREAKDNLAKTRLLAPISGTVTQLNKEEGEIAVGSEFQADPIMTVSDLSRMEVLSEIDENDVVLVSIGDKTKIEVDAIPDTFFTGQVSEIAHTATTRGRGTQEQVTNFEVKIFVTDDVKNLRPGMSSTVDINTQTNKDILFIPIQCVTVRDVKADSTSEKAENENHNDKEDDKTEVVFVVKDGKAVMTPVDTGISDDTSIEITGGLEEGQEVISGSYKAISRELEDESLVKVTNKDDDKKSEEEKGE